jgi:hypothetical protein
VLRKPLDDDAQQRSGEEQSDGILECDLVLIPSTSLVPFKVDQVVDDGEEDELIEEHDEDEGGVGEEARPSVIYIRLLGIVVDLAQLALDYLVLVVQQEVESHRESSQREQENRP